MGAIARVIDEAWAQRAEILRRSPVRPKMSLYLDTDTYRECLADPEVFRSARWINEPGLPKEIFGMSVFQVVTRDRHIRVAEVVS